MVLKPLYAGKRLFRIWLCIPLREVKDINARCSTPRGGEIISILMLSYSLDAVEDLISHATFEQEFTELAKGLPDLERIVSRIHANNCKVKDFVKVLAVRIFLLCMQFCWFASLFTY